MRTTELYLDPTDARLAHASPTCAHNLGLTEMALSRSDHALDELDQLVQIIDELGYLVPAWAGRELRSCPHCTLVRTTEWAVAA